MCHIADDNDDKSIDQDPFLHATIPSLPLPQLISAMTRLPRWCCAWLGPLVLLYGWKDGGVQALTLPTAGSRLGSIQG